MSDVPRADFPKWIVELKFNEQEGICANCGNSLAWGYHKHHKDGNRSNNNLENLELHCPRCHRAKSPEEAKKRYKAHEATLENEMVDLTRIIEGAFEGKLSGASIDKALETVIRRTSTSEKLMGYNEGIIPPPASFVLMRKMAEVEKVKDAYMAGIQEGIRMQLEAQRKTKK